MYPVLFHIKSFTLYSYGLFAALGFMTLMAVTRKYSKPLAISSETLSNLFIVILLSALVGARIMYVAINFDAYRANFLEIFKVWNGGLVFFGGFLLALPTVAVYLKIKGIDQWETADILSPGMALGHAVGRLGCFFAGCCYGRACDLPIAVRFTIPQALAPLNIDLHPTQIYEVFSNLILFIILTWLIKRKKIHGMVFLIYMMLYSVFRFIIEFFRGDFRGNFLFDFISISQGIGCLVFLCSFIILLWRIRSSHASGTI